MQKMTTLPNGLRIVTDEMQSVESAALGVWVGTGTRAETRKINGAAHSLEHMAFKGTRRRSARVIAEEIENVGGMMNAYTGRDVTAYYLRILRDDIPLAMDILADILKNSIFDPQELERERGVILQEINRAMDTPDDIIFDYFQETAYPNQPMGYPILGETARIETLTRKDIMNFMHSSYQPGNMVLAATGAISHAQIVALAQQNFGEHENHALPAIEPAHYVGGDFRHDRQSEQLHFILGFDGVSLHDADYYAIALLSGILGGGMSSRLFQEIREKRGLAYAVHSFASAYNDCGIFAIYTGTSAKDAQTIIPLIANEIQNLPTTLQSAEMKRAKAQLKSALLMGLENTSTRCETIATQTLAFGKPRPLDQMIANIDHVSTEDIGRVAKKVFASTPTVTALGPISHMDSYDKIAARFAT